MDFNLYQEIKQSLKDAIKFEANTEELHFGALENKIKEIDNK